MYVRMYVMYVCYVCIHVPFRRSEAWSQRILSMYVWEQHDAAVRRNGTARHGWDTLTTCSVECDNKQQLVVESLRTGERDN